MVKFAAKGTKVSVIGPVSARLYAGNDGTQRVSLDVTVEDFEFCSSRTDVPQATQAPAKGAGGGKQETFTPAGDDTLPF